MKPSSTLQANLRQALADRLITIPEVAQATKLSEQNVALFRAGRIRLSAMAAMRMRTYLEMRGLA